jgi:hypothetical protein
MDGGFVAHDELVEAGGHRTRPRAFLDSVSSSRGLLWVGLVDVPASIATVSPPDVEGASVGGAVDLVGAAGDYRPLQLGKLVRSGLPMTWS